MTNKQTTVIDDTWDALYQLLVAQSWPVHPAGTDAPEVHFADTNEPLLEGIVIVGIPTQDAAATVVTFGSTSSSEEEFTLRILLGSKVPGCDRETVRSRQKELCGIVLAAVRSTSTGRPAGGFSDTVPGVLWWERTRYGPQIYALPEGDGFGFYAEVDVLFHCYI